MEQRSFAAKHCGQIYLQILAVKSQAQSISYLVCWHHLKHVLHLLRGGSIDVEVVNVVLTIADHIIKRKVCWGRGRE